MVVDAKSFKKFGLCQCLSKMFVSSHQTQFFFFLDSRCGQGIKDLTWNINKPKMTLKMLYIPLVFKPIECMDTICVIQFLYYEPMMWTLCLKPSFFCGNKPSLYSCNIVGILIKLIFLGAVFFSIILTMLPLPGSFA